MVNATPVLLPTISNKELVLSAPLLVPHASMPPKMTLLLSMHAQVVNQTHTF